MELFLFLERQSLGGNLSLNQTYGRHLQISSLSKGISLDKKYFFSDRIKISREVIGRWMRISCFSKVYCRVFFLINSLDQSSSASLIRERIVDDFWLQNIYFLWHYISYSKKMNIAPPPKNLYLQYGRLFGADLV